MTTCKVPECGQPRTARSKLAARYRFCDEHYDEYNRAATLKAYRDSQSRAFDVLGRECAHCGFTDPRALQVDHREGGGRRHRQGLKGNGRQFYKDVVAHPEKYQVLCANCNQIKKIENGEL